MTEKREGLSLSLNGETLEDVDFYWYLVSIIGKNGGEVEDVIGRVNEGSNISGTINRLWKVRSPGVNVRMIYEGIVVPSVLFGGYMGSEWEGREVI